MTIAHLGAAQLRGAYPTRFPTSRACALTAALFAHLVCAVGASSAASAPSPALRVTAPEALAPQLREAGIEGKMSDTEAETEVTVLPPTAGIPTAEFIDNVDVFLERSRQVALNSDPLICRPQRAPRRPRSPPTGRPRTSREAPSL